MGIAISAIDILLLFQSEILKVFKPQKIEWKFILPIIKYGIPIAATSLSAWIITQSNKFIMNSISGFSEAALVGAGYGLTLPILMTLFAMITVAAIPRIINLYESKIDVRHIITRFLGYYILVSLPIITVISIYNVDYTHLFIQNKAMYKASTLVPYFSFGVFFLSMTDYTTLQYHLANKTHIDFIIKLISGIVGVILNVVLIPKSGLLGVGIATLIANFTYCLLSLIIVLPNLNLYFPKNTILKMILSAIPTAGILYLFRHFGNSISGLIQMLIILTCYYGFYYICGKSKLKEI
jgi:O-antigen/teichoic acid export membrane protein